MALAIDLINTCLTKTKSRFFPIRIKEWLKLGLIYILSNKGGGSGFSGANVNVPGSGEFVRRNLGMILGIGGIFFILGLFWRIISLTFSFIFIDGVVSKKNEIVNGFKNHFRKGFSVFLFTLAVTIINLSLLGLLGLPILLPIIENIGNLSLNVINIPYAIFFALFVVVNIIFISLLFWVVNNLVIYDMYRKNKLVLESLRRSFFLIKKNFLEVFLFLLFRFLLGIVAGIISLIVMLVLLIPFALIGIVLAIPFIAIGFSGTMGLAVALIIIGVIVGILLLFLFIYLLNVVLLPVNGFFTFYNYNFVKKLSEKHKM